MPWYRRVLLLVLSPFALLVSAIFIPLIAILGVWAIGCNYLSELLLRTKMRRQSRWLGWHEACGRIDSEGGTLVVEAPSLGWSFTHAWWTPDDVLTLSPHEVPTGEDCEQAAKAMECLDWDRWCWDNYTCPENGKALLLRVWNGSSIERKALRLFPNLQVVHTWTALVHVEEAHHGPGATAG